MGSERDTPLKLPLIGVEDPSGVFSCSVSFKDTLNPSGHSTGGHLGAEISTDHMSKNPNQVCAVNNHGT
jgi:hypothetical protein